MAVLARAPLDVLWLLLPPFNPGPEVLTHLALAVLTGSEKKWLLQYMPLRCSTARQDSLSLVQSHASLKGTLRHLQSEAAETGTSLGAAWSLSRRSLKHQQPEVVTLTGPLLGSCDEAQLSALSHLTQGQTVWVRNHFLQEHSRLWSLHPSLAGDPRRATLVYHPCGVT